MKASGTQLFNLLQGQQHFMIPLFQRTYSWTKENFESLWNDITEVYEAEEDERHFLGSVVTKSQDATPEGVSPFLVIDGQQRLTTLTLLLAALPEGIPVSVEAPVLLLWETLTPVEYARRARQAVESVTSAARVRSEPGWE